MHAFKKLTRIHRVNIIEGDSTQEWDDGMLGTLAVEIRIVQLGQFPGHRHPSACFDFRCGRLGNNFRGQDGELSKTFFMASWSSWPDLFGVGQFIERGVKEANVGHGSMVDWNSNEGKY